MCSTFLFISPWWRQYRHWGQLLHLARVGEIGVRAGEDTEVAACCNDARTGQGECCYAVYIPYETRPERKRLSELKSIAFSHCMACQEFEVWLVLEWSAVWMLMAGSSKEYQTCTLQICPGWGAGWVRTFALQIMQLASHSFFSLW